MSASFWYSGKHNKNGLERGENDWKKMLTNLQMVSFDQ